MKKAVFIVLLLALTATAFTLSSCDLLDEEFEAAIAEPSVAENENETTDDDEKIDEVDKETDTDKKDETDKKTDTDKKDEPDNKDDEQTTDNSIYPGGEKLSTTANGKTAKQLYDDMLVLMERDDINSGVIYTEIQSGTGTSANKLTMSFKVNGNNLYMKTETNIYGGTLIEVTLYDGTAYVNYNGEKYQVNNVTPNDVLGTDEESSDKSVFYLLNELTTDKFANTQLYLHGGNYKYRIELTAEEAQTLGQGVSEATLEFIYNSQGVISEMKLTQGTYKELLRLSNLNENVSVTKPTSLDQYPDIYQEDYYSKYIALQEKISNASNYTMSYKMMYYENDTWKEEQIEYMIDAEGNQKLITTFNQEVTSYWKIGDKYYMGCDGATVLISNGEDVDYLCSVMAEYKAISSMPIEKIYISGLRYSGHLVAFDDYDFTDNILVDITGGYSMRSIKYGYNDDIGDTVYLEIRFKENVYTTVNLKFSEINSGQTVVDIPSVA